MAVTVLSNFELLTLLLRLRTGFAIIFQYSSTKSVALFLLSKTHELSYNIFVPITAQESLIPERKCRCERLVLQPAVVKAYSTVC